MNKLQFKTFTWPSNPAVFREQWERNPQYTRDDTGNDVLIANIMGQEIKEDFLTTLLEKIGISPEVFIVCANAHTKSWKEVG